MLTTMRGHREVCEQCGSEYHVSPSRVKKRRYCSMECAHQKRALEATLAVRVGREQLHGEYACHGVREKC